MNVTMSFNETYWKYAKILFLLTTCLLIVRYIFVENAQNNNDLKSTQVTQTVWKDHVRFVNVPTSALKHNIFVNYSGKSALVDSRVRDFSQLFDESVKTLRNLPTQLLMLKRMNETDTSYNESCANFPTLFNLKFDNHWQVLQTPNGSAFLYGAYYDNRDFTLSSNESLGPVVRILGMMEANLCQDNSTIYYCQFWFGENKSPVFAPVTNKRFHKSYENEKHRMFLFSCNAPTTVPVSVSLVVNRCDNATNNLRVEYDHPTEKKDFAVCVKGLDFFHEDHSVRLVEWIELLHFLGADKIFIYELAVHPNVTKVLRYYENTVYVDVTRATLPGGLPTDPGLLHVYLRTMEDEKRAHEMIPYNDCLYRNIHKYKFLAMLDTDETIVPQMNLTWKEMMNYAESNHAKDLQSYSAICFPNIYFLTEWTKNDIQFPEIPKFMHQLQHIYRSKTYLDKWYTNKCFHNTERAIISYNHFPSECFGNCRRLQMPGKMANMQHYRTGCPKHIPNCMDDFEKKTVIDKNLWRYKDNLIKRTLGILESLGFIFDA